MWGRVDSVPRKKWTAALARTFISGRTNDGGVWAVSGGVIALGTGRVIAGVEGVEEVALSRHLSAVSGDGKTRPLGGAEPAIDTHAAELVSRTALFYTEPGSRRRLRSFRYRPTTPARRVSPVLAPAATLRVALTDAGSLALTRTGAGARVEIAGATAEASGFVRAAWAYVGRQRVAAKKRTQTPTPTRPGVVETYDYRVGKEGGTVSWSRVGRCPSWYGPGQCLTYLTGSKVRGGWRGLDAGLRAWLSEVGRSRPLAVADVAAGAKEDVGVEGGLTIAGVKPERRRKVFGIF